MSNNLNTKKVVLFGVTAKGVYDLRSTPFEKEYPGVEVHANVIDNIIESDYIVEGRLRASTQMNIKRLMDIGSYRGLRHRKSLPVRGQKTKTNAKTRKNFRNRKR